MSKKKRHPGGTFVGPHEPGDNTALPPFQKSLTVTTDNYTSPVDAIKLVKLDLLQADNIYILAKEGLKDVLQQIYWNKRQGLYDRPDGKEALAQSEEWKESIVKGMDAFAAEINRVGAIVYDEDPGLCRGGMEPSHPPIKEDPHLRELLED